MSVLIRTPLIPLVALALLVFLVCVGLLGWAPRLVGLAKHVSREIAEFLPRPAVVKRVTSLWLGAMIVPAAALAGILLIASDSAAMTRELLASRATPFGLYSAFLDRGSYVLADLMASAMTPRQFIFAGYVYLATVGLLWHYILAGKLRSLSFWDRRWRALFRDTACKKILASAGVQVVEVPSGVSDDFGTTAVRCNEKLYSAAVTRRVFAASARAAAYPEALTLRGITGAFRYASELKVRDLASVLLSWTIRVGLWSLLWPLALVACVYKCIMELWSNRGLIIVATVAIPLVVATVSWVVLLPARWSLLVISCAVNLLVLWLIYQDEWETTDQQNAPVGTGIFDVAVLVLSPVECAQALVVGLEASYEHQRNVSVQALPEAGGDRLTRFIESNRSF